MRALVFIVIFAWMATVSGFAQATVWPLSNSSSTADVITSAFGPREFFHNSLFKFIYQIHWGLDIRGNRGDPVHVIADGQVKTVGRNPNSSTGYFVDVETILPEGNTAVLIRYMHLNEEPILERGDWVCHYAGDCTPNSDPNSHNIVGYVGDSGTNTVHLHIAYYRDSGSALEPRLNSSNPLRILPETNRGLYQISEESMKVVNEGTSANPDYWLEFDLYIPPFQIDLRRLEYDLSGIKKWYKADTQTNVDILESRHNTNSVDAKNMVDDVPYLIFANIQQQRGYIDFEERNGIDHGERGEEGRPGDEMFRFYNGIRIKPDDFGGSDQAVDHKYKIRLEIEDDDNLLPDSLLGGFELHLRAFNKFNEQENLYIYETGSISNNGVFIMPVTWVQTWPRDLNTVPLGEERPWPNTILVGNAGKILVTTPSYPSQHALLPESKKLSVKSGGIFELEAGQGGGPYTIFTSRGIMDIQSGGTLKMSDNTLFQVIGTGLLDVDGTFDQSAIHAYLEVRDGGRSNYSSSSKIRDIVKVENGFFEIDPQKTVTISSGGSIEMLEQSGEMTIGSNSTLDLTGLNTRVNINQAGSKVYFNSDARITVQSGAKILADGVTFRTSGSGSAKSMIHLLSGGNTFANCTFEGTKNVLKISSENNLVENSLFQNSTTQIYATSGSVVLRNTQIKPEFGAASGYSSNSVSIESTMKMDNGEEPEPDEPAPDSAKAKRGVAGLNLQDMELQMEASPEEFDLLQSYPNPFNPTTTIAYDLPEQARVTINVYNIMGRRVATLVDRSQPAGAHTIRFNGRGLSSGLYIARLKASGVSGERFVKEIKMQLIK